MTIQQRDTWMASHYVEWVTVVQNMHMSDARRNFLLPAVQKIIVSYEQDIQGTHLSGAEKKRLMAKKAYWEAIETLLIQAAT